MNKKQRLITIGIVFIIVSISLFINKFCRGVIKLENMSCNNIVKGYENNIVNGEQAIAINGYGFQEGDKIYIENEEAKTAIGSESNLSFIVNKDLYKNKNKLILELRRFTPKGNILIKSNKKTIDIINIHENMDDTIVIEELSPEYIKEKQKENLIDNKVAISILGSGFAEGDTVYINGEPQQTAFGNENFLSCLIPRRYYNKTGKLEIQVKRTKNMEKTKIITTSKKEYIDIISNNIENYIWDRNKYIYHAMGIIDGNAYTNSLEAFLENYHKGVRVFEVDLIFTKDNHLVARHDWTHELTKAFKQDETIDSPMSLKDFKSQLIHKKYTPLTLEEILFLMKEYPDVYIVTDTKEIDEDKVREQFKYISKCSNNIDNNLLNRIIPQIYNPKMLDTIKSIYNWNNIIYTLYQSKQTPEEVVRFVKEKQIKAVAMPEGIVNEQFINDLLDEDIYIYLHTINDKKVAERYFNRGVWGIYTDNIAY